MTRQGARPKANPGRAPDRDRASTEENDPSLALLVGAARSGTTLLRVILDMHPEIGSPSEAGIPGLLSHLSRVWMTVEGAPATTTEIPEALQSQIADAVLGPMRHYCATRGKRIYVDKSLDSFQVLPLIEQFVPDGRYICLYRHVMDTIMSGIEASPWGFQAYGYAPYVHPGNFVAGLAAYWHAHVSAAVKWEKGHPQQCLRVRYEDMVARPGDVITGVQTFLGVDKRPDLASLAAWDPSTAVGPGDHKILATREVHTGSVGIGKRVPVSMIPPGLRSEVNELLEDLGYDALGDDWNLTPVNPSLLTPAPAQTERLEQLLAAACTESVPGAEPFAVLATNLISGRWLVTPRTRLVEQSTADVERTLIGSAEDLTAAIASDLNVAGAARQGRLRCATADADGMNAGEQDDVVHLVAFLRGESTGPALRVAASAEAA